jgi:hypothetical protein
MCAFARCSLTEPVLEAVWSVNRAGLSVRVLALDTIARICFHLYQKPGNVGSKEKEKVMSGVFYNAQRAMLRGSYPTDTVHIHTSSHNWLEDRGPVCDLLMFIYDPTGYLHYTVFVKPGDTKVYYEALKDYSCLYELPEAFCIDINSPFYTDFPEPIANFGRGYLFDFTILNKIEFHSDITPESKRKISRIDRITKDYMINILRMRDTSSQRDANKFLPKYIARINALANEKSIPLNTLH